MKEDFKASINQLSNSTISFIALNIYIFILLFLPKDISSIGFIPIRLVCSILLCLTIIYDIYRKNIGVRKNKNIIISIIFGLFLITTLPSVMVSKSPIISLYTVIKFGVNYALFFLLSLIDFKKEQYKLLLKNLLFSVFLLCIIGIVEYIFNINLFVAGIEYYKGAKGRIEVTFFNTIYYGIFLNLIFPIAFYAMCKASSKRVKWFLAVLCSLIYINLLFTFTRSAIIIFSLVLLLLIVFLIRISFNLRTLFVVLMVVLSTILIPGGLSFSDKAFDDVLKMASKVENILSFLPQTNVDDDSDYLEYDDNSIYIDPSLQHRQEFARIAKEIASDHKFTGVGFGTYLNYMDSDDFAKNYPEYTLSHTHPHSGFVLLSAECGIISLGVFVLFLTSLFIKVFIQFVVSFKEKKLSYELSVIILSIVCGFVLVNVMAENAFYDSQIFPIFLLNYSILFSYLIFIKKDGNKNIY